MPTTKEKTVDLAVLGYLETHKEPVTGQTLMAEVYKTQLETTLTQFEFIQRVQVLKKSLHISATRDKNNEYLRITARGLQVALPLLRR